MPLITISLMILWRGARFSIRANSEHLNRIEKSKQREKLLPRDLKENQNYRRYKVYSLILLRNKND